MTHYKNILVKRDQLLGPNLPTFYDQPVHLVKGKDVWVWDSTNEQAVKLYTHRNFEGKYIGTLQGEPGSVLRFKFLLAPKGVQVNKSNLSQMIFEYGGIGNDREFGLQSLNLHSVTEDFFWGYR